MQYFSLTIVIILNFFLSTHLFVKPNSDHSLQLTMHPEVRNALELTAKFLEQNLLMRTDYINRSLQETHDRAGRAAFAAELGAINHILVPLLKRHSMSPMMTDLRLSNLLAALMIVDRPSGPVNGPTLTEYVPSTSQRLPRTRKPSEIDVIQLRNPPNNPDVSKHTLWIDKTTNTWYRAVELNAPMITRLRSLSPNWHTKTHHRLPGTLRRANRAQAMREHSHTPEGFSLIDLIYFIIH
jgi:hypothetical protein